MDDDEPPANFNSDKGDFEIKLRKKEVGQHFPDLDLLGKLLAPKKQKLNIKPSIEVLAGKRAQKVADIFFIDLKSDSNIFNNTLKLLKTKAVLSQPSNSLFGSLKTYEVEQNFLVTAR